MNKEQIFDIILKYQQLLIEELEQNLRNFTSEADIDEEATRDLDDMSNQVLATDMRNSANQQLVNAKNDFEELKRYSLLSKENAVKGAMVTTDQRYFILGVPFKSINEEGDKEIIGVSVESPAYQLMKNLKKGDSFELKGHKYYILSID